MAESKFSVGSVEDVLSFFDTPEAMAEAYILLRHDLDEAQRDLADEERAAADYKVSMHTLMGQLSAARAALEQAEQREQNCRSYLKGAGLLADFDGVNADLAALTSAEGADPGVR